MMLVGMFQRLDRMRKHAFGSMILAGKNHDSQITGLWFWRGQDLAFTVSFLDHMVISNHLLQPKKYNLIVIINIS